MMTASRHRGIKASSAAIALAAMCAMPWCVDAFMAAAHAGMQHLVAPGENWETLASKLQPGDEIILMPGRHKPATFEKLRGTQEAPITIHGLDAANPPEIAAARHGLLLIDPQNVVIENVRISGASIAGIALRSRGKSEADAGGGQSLNTANVRILNVQVTKIGPSGRRDAIEIVGQERVQIERCTFEGWAGAAVAMLACNDISIDECAFKGLPDHSQSEGVLMRAGTKNVVITNSRFENLPGPAIFAGGRSEADAFQPAVAPDAKPGSIYECRHIQVQRCVFTKMRMPIMMQSADDVLVRSCTFVRPLGCVVMLDHKHEDDPRFAASSRLIFGDNIVVWQPEDLQMYVLAVPHVDLTTLAWERNLWWSDEPLEAREKLGELQGGLVSEQIMDVNPRLDDEFKPQEESAKAFGAFAP